MQPNNPYQQPGQQPQQFSGDYLNQIAAPAPVKTINPVFLWGLIGGLLLLAVVVLIGVSSASSGPSASSLTAVGAKLANLQTVSEGARKNIQSSELRTLNSSLYLSLTNTNRDLAEQLKKQDIKLTDKKNASVTASAKETEELQGRLEDARLNAVYDRTYAREMLYQLRTLHSDMGILYKKSRNNDLKEILNTADNNFNPVIEGLASFNES